MNGLHVKTPNCRTCTIDATLHTGFLCLGLYFHEYVNFINHYSDHSTLGVGRGERGGREEHHVETFQLPCSVHGEGAQRGEMRSVIIYTRRINGGNTGSAGD